MRALPVQSGFAPERVHVDLFSSPASSEWGPPRVPRADVPLRVDSAAGSFAWEPAAGSLLNAAESAGLDWPSECRVGVCGTCVRTVTHGEFRVSQRAVVRAGARARRRLQCRAADPSAPGRRSSRNVTPGHSASEVSGRGPRGRPRKSPGVRRRASPSRASRRRSSPTAAV
ncbi:2Fe-2S iron-sulfur cluster-binding protein [Microbacterium oxydans]|uniref:2Fe-2S iron-sulfur cluster-binding protein n=1 Tax=Microbacterium oxydans TaxID=82380 RepID=UPI00366D991A